jgi:hypothetical protein
MKTINLSLVIAVVIVLASCKGKNNNEDPQPTAVETALKQLTGKWTLQSLTIDGVASTEFSGLTITFNAPRYSSSNGEPVWPSTGMFEFTDETATALIRNDKTTVDIVELDDTHLTLSLNWSQSIEVGRSNAIGGKHVFVMTK